MCTSAPARPFLYEGVFAHEYQHLLEYYEDPEEVNWVNEGLSDFAIDVTGYATRRARHATSASTATSQCFLGCLGIRRRTRTRSRGRRPGELANALG